MFRFSGNLLNSSNWFFGKYALTVSQNASISESLPAPNKTMLTMQRSTHLRFLSSQDQLRACRWLVLLLLKQNELF